MTKAVNGFIRLDRDLVQSDRWRSLSTNARVLLIDVWSHYNGHNNGAIRFSIREAERSLSCSRRTAIRTFSELCAAGWLEAVERGGFRYKVGSRVGVATAWRITGLPGGGDHVPKI